MSCVRRSGDLVRRQVTVVVDEEHDTPIGLHAGRAIRQHFLQDLGGRCDGRNSATDLLERFERGPAT